MELVADIDRERSFDAMWCAYLTSNSVVENLAKNRTSVVRAFLNARYYNSAQGQFLSEDPVFLGNPKQQNLTDPQSLNTYSYSNDNPITKEDPSGKYVAVDARSLQNIPFGTHTAFDVIPQNPSLINYSALGIPAGTKEFTIGFYAGSDGNLVPSVTYAGGTTNPGVLSQGMADYNKTGLKGVYPFTGRSASGRSTSY